MHCFVLQDWTTIRGGSQSPAVPIPQTEQSWLDLTPFQDVYFWLDVREVTGATPTIAFETSPSSDDSLFQPMVSAVSMQASATPTLVRAPMATATWPLARFVRWKLLGPASALWDVTFGVLVTANSPGMSPPPQPVVATATALGQSRGAADPAREELKQAISRYYWRSPAEPSPYAPYVAFYAGVEVGKKTGIRG